MFTERSLSDELADLRGDHTPDCAVFDCEDEFETMPEEWVYELALVTEGLESLAHPAAWVPDDAIPAVRRTTGVDPVIGMPDDGSVTWTHQTEPPLVLVKPRASQLPEPFREFLIAEAIVELGRELPETPVGFFEARYPAVQAAMDDPTNGFQVAAALRRGWIGLQTRSVFEDWDATYPHLHAAWMDAGERLAGRVEEIPSLRAEQTLDFAGATELAGNAIKHGIALPAPFDALDVSAFVDEGPTYALTWLEETAP